MAILHALLIHAVFKRGPQLKKFGGHASTGSIEIYDTLPTRSRPFPFKVLADVRRQGYQAARNTRKVLEKDNAVDILCSSAAFWRTFIEGIRTFPSPYLNLNRFITASFRVVHMLELLPGQEIIIADETWHKKVVTCSWLAACLRIWSIVKPMSNGC